MEIQNFREQNGEPVADVRVQGGSCREQKSRAV
ncbi:hypothetical protein N752_22365 [Desulforamulus aquiferis]|nr:hypothetical protein N752_22365 [Desulforamulus aquiferis]